MHIFDQMLVLYIFNYICVCVCIVYSFEHDGLISKLKHKKM
jgi:hypothetical protein